MLAPSKPRAPRMQRVAHQIATVLPPVRGINSTGAAAGMTPEDALDMDNWISTDLGLAVRGGWFEYATNIGGPVDGPRPIRTVMPYNGSPAGASFSPLSSSELFAVCDTGIFSIEGGGNLASLVADIALSGASDAGRMSYTQLTNEAGQFLIACSEVDGGFVYDGASWHKMVLSAGSSPWEVSNIDPALFVHPVVYKHRIGYVERGSSRVWWTTTLDATGGPMEVSDFGPMLSHGGMVLACMQWTQDAGDGIDDKLVILSSSGDLLVYQGTDPTDPAQFAHVGTWYIGPPPVGRRCFTDSGGSPYVLTVFGVIPVSQVVQGGLDNILIAGTEYLQRLRRLQNVLNTDFTSLHGTLGWEVLTVPDSALLFIARPSIAVGEYIQYAFQQHNLAWSRLLDMPAHTFGRRLNELYGGTEDGRVLRVLAGEVDGTKLDATGFYEIRARLTPAFHHFGMPTVRKQALMMRVNFLSNQEPGYTLQMNADYAVRKYSPAASPGPMTSGSLWNASIWDAAFWSGGRVAQGQWRSVEGFGYALAPTIYVSVTEATTMASIEYMTKAGGPL